MSVDDAVTPFKRDRTSSWASSSKHVNGLQGRLDNEPTDEDAGSEADDAPLEALLPLSHDHPLLGVDDPAQWSVDEFLLSRSHVPLEELRGELRDYLARLREELGELINDDYEEFISLGLGLRGEGERLSALRQPLEELKGEVQHIQDSLSSSKGVVESLLSERTEIRKQKELIDLLLHLTDALERTEGLLGLANVGAHHDSTPLEHVAADDLEDEDVFDGDLPPDTDRMPSGNGPIPSVKLDEPLGNGPVSPDLDLKTLYRVANEYTQVTYLLEKAQDEGCAFVIDSQMATDGEEDGEQIQSRVSAIRLKLREELDRVFAELIASRSAFEPAEFRSRIEQCLRAYQIIQESSAAQQVARQYVAAGLATLIDSRSLLVAPSPAAPATPSESANGELRAPKTPFTPFGGPQGNLFELALANSANAKRNGVLASDSFEALDETSSPLAGVYNAVLRFIDTECLALLDVSEALNAEAERTGGEARFDFLANVIWTEVAKRITEEIGSSVFAAGRVSELHQNYLLTQAFLAKIESFSPSLRAVEHMRASEAYASFDRRWQLPVYFQLRWKEIVTALEEALQQPIGNERGREGYVMPQTLAAFQAIRTCWSPGVYLPELAGRFWRLTLQILSRYRVWLEGAAPALFDPERQPNIKAQAPQPPQTQPSSRNSLTLSRSATPVPGPTLPTGDPSTDPAAAAAEENVLRISTLIAIDLRRLKRDLAQFWTDDLSSLFGEAVNDEQAEEIRSTFDHVLGSLDNLMKSPDSHALSILTRRCAESLKLIRSVASQLRTSATSSTNTPVPSHFIAAVFKPAKDYFGVGGVGEALKSEVGASWNRIILEEVVAGYAAILLSVRKTEDLLRRHRKGKKTGFSLFGSGAAQQPTQSVEAEEERFKAQMTTDIDALAREANGLGVDATSVEGWTALRQVVESPVVDNA